jgi:hypothetical protein
MRNSTTASNSRIELHGAIDAVIHRDACGPSNSCPNRSGEWQSTRIKGMAMTEQQKRKRMALERKEIAARVAIFKATQEKFQRDREAYYEATMKTARAVRRNKSADGALRR